MSDDGVKVSVAMITYNHERFIEQAVRSVLMQEVDFVYEIVIGEDCSTDRTREILAGLTARHPDRIRLLPRPTNLGAARNFVDVLRNCRGDYVALLEGDDYWCAPTKLQIQTDFLDDHPECSLCFHWASFLNEWTGEVTRGGYGPVEPKCFYDLDDLLATGNFIPTVSVLFRGSLMADLPEWYVEMAVGDFPMNVLWAMRGRLGFIDATMAVYRRHANGVHSGRAQVSQLKTIIEVYHNLAAHLNLESRRSYRLGLANQHAQLCWALRGEGGVHSPIQAAWKALSLAPDTHKGVVLFHLLRHAAKRLYGKVTSQSNSRSAASESGDVEPLG